MRAAQIGQDGIFYDSDGNIPGRTAGPRVINAGNDLFARQKFVTPVAAPDSRLAGFGQTPAVTPPAPPTFSLSPLPPSIREIANIQSRSARGMRLVKKVIGDWNSEVFLGRVVLPAADPTSVCFVSFRQPPEGKVWLVQVHSNSYATWKLVDEAELLSDRYLVCNPYIDQLISRLWPMLIPVEGGEISMFLIDPLAIFKTVRLALDSIIDGSFGPATVAGTRAGRKKQLSKLSVSLTAAEAFAIAAIDNAAMSIDCFVLTVRSYSLVFTTVKDLLGDINALNQIVNKVAVVNPAGSASYEAVGSAVSKIMRRFEYYNAMLDRAALWVAGQLLYDITVTLPVIEQSKEALEDLLRGIREVEPTLSAEARQTLAGLKGEVESYFPVYDETKAVRQRVVADLKAKFGGDQALWKFSAPTWKMQIDANLVILKKAKERATSEGSFSGLGDLGNGGRPPRVTELRREGPRASEYDVRANRAAEELKKAEAEAERLTTEAAKVKPGEWSIEYRRTVENIQQGISDFLATDSLSKIAAQEIADAQNAALLAKRPMDLKEGEYEIVEGQRKPILIKPENVSAAEIKSRVTSEGARLLASQFARIKGAGKLIADLATKEAMEVRKILAERAPKEQKKLSEITELEAVEAEKVAVDAKAKLDQLGKKVEELELAGQTGTPEYAQAKNARAAMEIEHQRVSAIAQKLRKASETIRASLLEIQSERIKEIQNRITALAVDIESESFKAVGGKYTAAGKLAELFQIAVGELPRMIMEVARRPELSKDKNKMYAPATFAENFAIFAHELGIGSNTAAEVVSEYVRSYFPGDPAYRLTKTSKFGIDITKPEFSHIPVLEVVQAALELRLVELRKKMGEPPDSSKLTDNEKRDQAAIAELMSGLQRIIEGKGETANKVYADHLNAEGASLRDILVGEAPSSHDIRRILWFIRETQLLAKSESYNYEMKAEIEKKLAPDLKRHEKIDLEGDRLYSAAFEAIAAISPDGKGLASFVESQYPSDAQLQLFADKLATNPKYAASVLSKPLEAAQEAIRKIQAAQDAKFKYQKHMRSIWTISFLTKSLRFVLGVMAFPLSLTKMAADSKLQASPWLYKIALGLGVLGTIAVWRFLVGNSFFFFRWINTGVSGLTSGTEWFGGGDRTPDVRNPGSGIPELDDKDKPAFGIWDVAIVGLVIGAITVPKVIFPTISGLIRDTFQIVRDILVPGKAKKGGPGRPKGAPAGAPKRAGPGRPPGTGKKQEIAVQFARVHRIYQEAKSTGDDARANDALRRLNRLKAEYEGAGD